MIYVFTTAQNEQNKEEMEVRERVSERHEIVTERKTLWIKLSTGIRAENSFVNENWED